MTKNVTRYDIRAEEDDDYGLVTALYEKPDGQWVLYENVQSIIDRLQAENDALRTAIFPKALHIEISEITEHDRNALAKAIGHALGNHSGNIFTVPSFSEENFQRHADANVTWRKIEEQP